MKVKSMKRVLATALSATMVLGMSATVLAEPVDVTAPIYSLNVESYVVPTTYKVAFNPGELTVKTGDSSTSTAQVISLNYGMINNSSKDKIVTVSLKVEDQNENSPIEFVKSEAEVTNAAADAYAIYLAAVPADSTAIQAGGAAIDKDTAAAALADVTMTAATAKAVALAAGDNQIGFRLGKATYAAKTGSDVTLGTTNSNDVSSNYEVSAVGGSTAFTFAGKMKETADWSKLTAGIKITAVYTIADAGEEEVIDGTGAMVQLEAAPTFTASTTEAGVINYTKGLGDTALKSIKSITMVTAGKTYDGYHALSTQWTAATDENGKITLDSKYYTRFKAAPEATITYIDASDEEHTVKVNVTIEVVEPEPDDDDSEGEEQEP